MITNILILQPIDLCNLNCSYCYLPGRRNPEIMTDETLEASIRITLTSSFVNPLRDKEYLTINWHTGEPLAAGIPFFQRAVDLIKKYNQKKINIKHSVQTNATLINQKWCDFFLANGFEIGISVDGPQFLHDMHRKDWQGKGSFIKVMQGIEILRKNGFPIKAIAVLTKESLKYPNEIYHFFAENDFDSIGFNIDEIEGVNYTSSMNVNQIGTASAVEQYRNFMSTLYDLWHADGKKIKIREFDGLNNVIAAKKAYAKYRTPNLEILPFSIISITKNGNITTFSPEMSTGLPHDKNFFVVGNVLGINTLDDLITTSRFQTLKKEIFLGVSNCAAECAYFDLCAGGSPSNKYYEKGSFSVTETTNCLFTKKTLIDLVLDKLEATQI